MKVVSALLALAGLYISLRLTYLKWTDQITTLSGCGTGSSCENVLGSRWSVVFTVVPVSLLSAVLYVGLLVFLWKRGGLARGVRLVCGWMLLGAAAWFILLQAMVVKEFCIYCMSMHGVGLVLGVLLLLGEVKRGVSGHVHLRAFSLAMVSVMGLAAAQYLGKPPPTHRLDTVSTGGEEKAADIHGEGEGRVVKFFNQKKSYRVGALPHLGSVDADCVVVKYFDYTCDACKDMHDDFEKLMAKYPGRLTVIVLPTPLSRKCNPHLPLGVSDHVNACGLARLALLVWRADATKFAEFHHSLFKMRKEMGNVPVELAETMAQTILAGKTWNTDDEKWADEVIRVNCEDYKMFVTQTHVMPKLVLKGSKVQQGVTRDTETLHRVLREHAGLK